MLTWSSDAVPAAAPIPSVTLNHGSAGVTEEGVWETSVRGGASAEARATAAGAPPEWPVAAAGAVPRSAVTTTASEQRAVLPQRIDTGRG
jgi:hypothetical protein